MKQKGQALKQAPGALHIRCQAMVGTWLPGAKFPSWGRCGWLLTVCDADVWEGNLLVLSLSASVQDGSVSAKMTVCIHHTPSLSKSLSSRTLGVFSKAQYSHFLPYGQAKNFINFLKFSSSL